MDDINDLDDLFDGDDGGGVDSRYAKDVISSGKAEKSSLDSYVMLSKELGTKKYSIRTYDHQEIWTRKKSNNQKQLARYLLKLDSVVRALIENCNKTEKHLFGILIEGPNGTKIKYDVEIHDTCKQMLQNYLDGDQTLTIDEISDILIDEYNLSYCHFIKHQAEKKIAEYESLKSIVQTSEIELSAFNLFPDLKNPVEKYAHEQGLSWYSLNSILRNVKVLSTSISQYKERLVSTNLRACLSNAMAYYHSTGASLNSSFDHLDLISEASIGLMHACDMYVYGIDARLTTYADFWIKLRVSRYIKNNNSVRVPIHVTEQVNKILGVLRNNRLEGGPALSKTDVESKLNLKREINDAIWQLAQNRDKGVATCISCVTGQGEDGEFSFDRVSEIDEPVHDSENISNDALRIIDLAKSMALESEDEDFRITKEQLDFILLKYVDDLTNSEIAEKYGAPVDVKYVRTNSKIVLDKLKSKLELNDKLNRIISYHRENEPKEGLVHPKMDIEDALEMHISDYVWSKAVNELNRSED